MRPIRWVQRGLEAVDLVVSYAADAPSRRQLLSAYVALLNRTWNPSPFEIRLRIEGRIIHLKLRQRDIYVLGEILHDRVYGTLSDLPPQPTVVDAGANVGVFSVWLSCCCPGVVTHCFEPEPENFKLLEYNLRAFKGECHQAALGAANGSASFYLSNSFADHSLIAGEGARDKITVPCLRLGDYIQERGIEVDLLKLDVEGSELDVLRGLGEGLDRVKRIVGECHERLVDAGALYAFLADRGHRLVSRRWPRRAKEHGVHVFETVCGGPRA